MSMSKQEREIRMAKVKSSRAYGKNIGEKKAMGFIKRATNELGFEWTARVSYRRTESFRDWNEWRVDIYINGSYFCHDLFETIEEAERYANGMVEE